MLKDNGRSLMLTQWKVIRDCIKVNASPLYVQSVGYEALTQWTSSHDAAELQLQPTMDFVIRQLLTRLVKRHGQLFISHALGMKPAHKPNIRPIFMLLYGYLVTHFCFKTCTVRCKEFHFQNRYLHS